MLADMDFCPGGSPSGKSGGGGAVVFIAGGMTAVAAGYLIGQAAHDLVQDIGGYVTPDTGPAGSTVHADPLPVTSSASTSFPLADGGPQTSIPASTGVFNNTLNVLADPLPEVDPTGYIYTSQNDHEVYVVRNPTTGQVVIYVGRTSQGLAAREKQHRDTLGRQGWELESVRQVSRLKKNSFLLPSLYPACFLAV